MEISETKTKTLTMCGCNSERLKNWIKRINNRTSIRI